MRLLDVNPRAIVQSRPSHLLPSCSGPSTILCSNAGEDPVAREQRKLAAILAADVVGYSRFTGRKDSGMPCGPARASNLRKRDCRSGTQHLADAVMGKPHQRRWGFAGLGDATIGEGGLFAADCDGKSLPPRRNAAATLKAAIAPRAHQPTQACFTTCDQSFSATRGGVIARVWISIRQKSNRPLRSM